MTSMKECAGEGPIAQAYETPGESGLSQHPFGLSSLADRIWQDYEQSPAYAEFMASVAAKRQQIAGQTAQLQPALRAEISL